MRNLLHHAAKRRRIRPHHYAIHFLKAKRPHDHLMLFRSADRAAYQFDLNRSSHLDYPTFSCTSPRISATSPLSRNCSSASMVAFTTLCGLCDPIDLVSTLGIPTAVITARTGPPAITPVPSGAGFSSTSPLPNRPSTVC